MPLTPLHLAAALPLKKHISVTAFIIVNLLIDAETVIIVIFGMDKLGYPLHMGMHTLGGSVITIGITLLLRPFYEKKFIPWLYGALLGAYSHIFLDALVHSDVEPFSPFIDGNPLYLDIHAEVSIFCAVVLSFYLAKWVQSLRISEMRFSRFIQSRWSFLSRILFRKLF